MRYTILGFGIASWITLVIAAVLNAGAGEAPLWLCLTPVCLMLITIVLILSTTK